MFIIVDLTVMVLIPILSEKILIILECIKLIMSQFRRRRLSVRVNSVLPSKLELDSMEQLLLWPASVPAPSVLLTRVHMIRSGSCRMRPGRGRRAWKRGVR